MPILFKFLQYKHIWGKKKNEKVEAKVEEKEEEIPTCMIIN